MEKLYFSIGEVAELLGVSQSLLRFWETEFDCIKPHKNKKGNRSYTEQDIFLREKCKSIHRRPSHANADNEIRYDFCRLK